MHEGILDFQIEMHHKACQICLETLMQRPQLDPFSFTTYKKAERLDLIKALFGGGRNAIKLYHKAECDEKIHYF